MPSGTPAPCGTDAGYSRHRRRDEIACDPCRTAHADATRAWKRAHQSASERRSLTRAETARQIAVRALINRHPMEFARLENAALLRLAGL